MSKPDVEDILRAQDVENKEVSETLKALFDIAIEKSMRDELGSFFKKMFDMAKSLPTKKQQIIAKRTMLSSMKTASGKIFKDLEGRLFKETMDAGFSSEGL